MSLPLLHSPADIARWVLIAVGGGTDPLANGAWPIYTDLEPTEPDNCLTVYDTTAKSDGRSMIDGETFTHYGIQVRVRGTSKQVAHPKAEAVRVLMDEHSYTITVVLDGTSYTLHCFAGTSLLNIGKDVPNSKRHLCTINALVTVRRW